MIKKSVAMNNNKSSALLQRIIVVNNRQNVTAVIHFFMILLNSSLTYGRRRKKDQQILNIQETVNTLVEQNKVLIATLNSLTADRKSVDTSDSHPQPSQKPPPKPPCLLGSKETRVWMA
jgi:archaellum biogenesis ATPase FlaH